jgi:hypothetical protein
MKLKVPLVHLPNFLLGTLENQKRLVERQMLHLLPMMIHLISLVPSTWVAVLELLAI